MKNDPENILQIWKNYVEDLYDRKNRKDDINLEPEEEVQEDDKGTTIMRNEMEKAIKNMKRGKATGDDNIPVDLLKKLRENGMSILTEIINHIYRKGVWPQNFLKVTISALKKKPQAKKCSDHRTISLMSHFGKIVARILNRRLEKKAEEILGEEQFRRGKGTRDAIGMMRIIPTLFDIYGEHLAKAALGGLGDFKIGGRLIKNMNYANDLVILAQEPTSLQKMMKRLVELGKKYGMEIYLEKSKVMRISA